MDAVSEGLLDKGGALLTIDANRLDALLHPTFDPSRDYEVLARGVAASPGAARGAIVFSADEAVERGGAGEEVILVRPFTEAEDVAGFAAARGILTSEEARPRTRRSSPGGWVGRASAAPRSWTSTSRRGSCTWTATTSPRGR